jgi:hypothetical protein
MARSCYSNNSELSILASSLFNSIEGIKIGSAESGNVEISRSSGILVD